jgi:2-phospho-L-lactate guanylyltransferase
MLRLVLRAVLTVTRDVIIIGSDKEVKKTSEDYDLIFEQDRTSSLNEAVGQAVRRSIHRKFDAVLVVAADLPFLSSFDLRRLMEESRDESIVICPSKDCGTNALFLSPPQSIGARFGSHSFVSHLKAAMGSRRRFKIFWSSGLSFDVDTPRDLRVAAQRGKKLHAL